MSRQRGKDLSTRISHARSTALPGSSAPPVSPLLSPLDEGIHDNACSGLERETSPGRRLRHPTTNRHEKSGPGEVLVTGGGGFLGRAIVEQLVAQGRRVRSFSRRSHPELGALHVTEYQGDLADREAVKHACQGCVAVYHVAAKAGIWGDYQSFHRVNVVGSENVIEACRSLGIRKLVYTGSPSVVFDGQDMEGAKESVPYSRRFKAAYPQTKALAEQKVLAANGPRLATVALRPHLIWGPRDSHIVPGIIARGRTGQLRRIGRDSKLVDFTYIDNAAAAHVLAGARLEPGSPISGRAFFVTDGHPMPFWDFVNRVLAAADLPPVRSGSIPRRLAYAAGWTLETVYKVFRLEGPPRLTRFLAEELSTAHWFDITAARTELGYEPRVGFEEGLSRLREWLQNRQQ